jgi:hypothetical protein
VKDGSEWSWREFWFRRTCIEGFFHPMSSCEVRVLGEREGRES